MANYKRVFLDGYSYFITIVTYKRQPLLIDNIELLRKSFALSKKKYAYNIGAIIVLPDHLHMIITPKNANDYPKIVTHIKRSFVYGLEQSYRDYAKTIISSSQYKRKLAGIWQKRFYEHTIRNEQDWLEKIDYIRSNSVKHKLVGNWQDWKYSSFVK
jgi:putative transposase